MAIIAMPASVRIASINWDENDPAQVNESSWTGDEQVVTNPWHKKRSGEATLAPLKGEASILDWRAFLSLIKGRVNTFRMIAVENAQIASGFTVTTTGGGAAVGATTLALTGMPPSTTIPKGRLLTVQDQLVTLTLDMSVNGSGAATATFSGDPLRQAVAAAVAVELRYPTCHVALTGSTRGYSVEPGQIYGISLQFQERFIRA